MISEGSAYQDNDIYIYIYIYQDIHVGQCEGSTKALFSYIGCGIT